MSSDERLVENYIPDNYEAGVSFMGFNFKTRFLFEGSVLGTITGAIGYQVLDALNVKVGSQIGLTICFLMHGLIIGLRGINDEPISSFIMCYVRFRKRRRTAFYNPRVKKEALPFNKEQDKKLPIEKAMELYQKYKSKFEKENVTKEEKVEVIQDNLYFIDDLGYVEKPLAYMSKKEYKNYLKELKKKEKLEKKRRRIK